MKLLLITLLFFNSNPVDSNDSDDLITGYLDALGQTLHGNTAEDDIDRLMNLYATDVVYEHPRVGIKLESKAVIKQGAMAFMKSYGGTSSDVEIDLISVTKGKGVSVISFSLDFQTKDGQKVNRRQTQVLEHNGSEISRIIDYW